MLFSTLTKLKTLSQPIYMYTQKSNYIQVTMKWKKDSFYDSIPIIHNSQHLKPLIKLKNCILTEPNGCVPISAISKRGHEFGIPMKVASFLRLYPSVFEEFTGPQFNLPWFRLTRECVKIDEEERRVYDEKREEFVIRLKKFVLMSKDGRVPLKIVQGMQWYLGLPDGFLENLDESFEVLEMGGGVRGLSVLSRDRKRMVSVLERNGVMKGDYVEGSKGALAFPMFPSKVLRLKRKIVNWLDMFQKVPYVSPYEDWLCLNPSSDVSEKRVVGVLHELLSLFVDHSAERKKLFCLRSYFPLPQKFYKAFQRHPHMFYLSLRNKTCTVILKEAYNDDSAMDTHPILEVRKKYIRLMESSVAILKNRRQKKQPLRQDFECSEETEVEDLMSK